MSAELPEDVNDWPRDPHRILGVQHGCSEDDLRKAYAACVRKYRPDRHPEQFQRIRTAYEQIKNFLPFLQSTNVETSEGASNSTSAAVSIAETFRTEDELAQVDAAIREDRCEDAHYHLRRLVEQQGALPAFCARLFWLTEIAPELDREHDRAYWLIEGLKRTSHDFRCRELLRRMVELSPRETLTEHYRDWLETLPIGPNLFEAMAWRWRAAARVGRWNAILEDMDRWEPKCRSDVPFLARLQLHALDYLIWRPEDTTHERCEQWIESLQSQSYLHNQMQREFHRLDILLDLYHGVMAIEENLARLPLLMTDIVHLATVSWYLPLIEYRPRLYAFLETLLTDPVAGLEALDQVRRFSPVVIAQLSSVLENLFFFNRHIQRPELPVRPLLQAVDDHFRAIYTLDYARFRIGLLDFCMREYVEVPELLAILSQSGTGYEQTYNFVQAFDDAPLTCLVQAHCLYWL